MTTSGSANYSINRNDILQAALRRINILAQGQDMSNDTKVVADLALNLMIKEWQADGLNLWAVLEATLFLTTGQKSYNLSSSSSDHIVADSALTETAVKVAITASDTTIDVDSTTGMTVADNIGVMQDDGTIHWDTIASITDSDTVVLTTGVVSATAVDNGVYFYTNKINRPLRLVSARRYINTTSEYDIPVVSRREYNNLPDKKSTGSIVQVYYEPQLTNGVLYTWPPTDSESDRLKLTVQRPIEDFDNATDNPDFPIEWGNAIIWNLALQLCGEYQVNDSILKRVAAFASDSKTRASNFDQENVSIFFQPSEELYY